MALSNKRQPERQYDESGTIKRKVTACRSVNIHGQQPTPRQHLFCQAQTLRPRTRIPPRRIPRISCAAGPPYRPYWQNEQW
jgi:hypothetical protein